METMEIPAISVHPGDLTDEPKAEIFDFEYKVINVVCLGILTLKKSKTIDFDAVEKRITVKRLNRFPCIMFKLQLPKNESISCILFRNGKIILTGIKKQASIPLIKKEVAKNLKKGGIEFTQFTVEIQNLVVMTNLHRLINLELSCLSLTNCLYEPEQFPAAIVKTGKSTCLIFSNSKIISLGNKTEEDMRDSLRGLIQDIFDQDLFIKKYEDTDDLLEIPFDDEDLFF